MAKSKGPQGPRFASLVEKSPTSTQIAFSEWLSAHSGYAVDVTSVKLAMQLTKEFRSDPAQAEAREARKLARASHSADVEARRIKRNEERAAKLEEKARAIRAGEVRGPGRPPRSESAAVEAEAVAEAVETEVAEEAAAEGEVVTVESDDDF